MPRLIARLEIVLAVPVLLLAAAAGRLEPYKEMAAMAQGGPDFSGRWTAVPEPAPAAGVAADPVRRPSPARWAADGAPR